MILEVISMAEARTPFSLPLLCDSSKMKALQIRKMDGG